MPFCRSRKNKDKKKLLETIDENEKVRPFRQIQVSVSAFLEAYSDKSKMDLRIPHFVIHDFADEEESKIIRMILEYAKIPYGTKTVDREEFITDDYPFYCLPMLEVNKVKLGSVPSICRQLGWRYELSAYNAKEDSLVDMFGEKVFEARLRLKQWLDHIEHREEHECDESCSDAQAFQIVTSICNTLERTLKNNSSPWLVGHRISWADLLVCCLFNPIIYHHPQLFDQYPMVYLLNKRIAEMDVFAGFLYHVKARKF